MAFLGHEARLGLSRPLTIFGELSPLSPLIVECFPCTGCRTFSSLQPAGHSGFAYNGACCTDSTWFSWGTRRFKGPWLYSVQFMDDTCILHTEIGTKGSG